MKRLTLNPISTRVIADTLFSSLVFFIIPADTTIGPGRTKRRTVIPKRKVLALKGGIYLFLVSFYLSVFTSITPALAQKIKGFEYYKVITGQFFAEKEASTSPFQISADESGGQIKVQVKDYFPAACSEQVTFKWSFDRVLQFFPAGEKFTITGQVGVSGNCTEYSNPFFLTSSGGSAAAGLPQKVLNMLSESEQVSRGLTLESMEAGRAVHGKGGANISRVGAGSDTYSFQGGGILFLKIFFNAGGSLIDQFYNGFAIYFFRPVYADGATSGGAISGGINGGSNNVVQPGQWKECETSQFGKFCGTWTLNTENKTGQATWENGAKATLVIETLTRSEVVITRQDNSGLRATYRGKVQGNSVSGDFSFYWSQENIYKGTWNASW